ncbi:MAG TPA: hypothetical protein VEP66_09505 [Myxococcales bacterium]|nr:hypothetical protein [Myxococcales bacterium]
MDFENTIFGRRFICFATSGNCFAATGVGQNPAIISYVFRPKTNTPPPRAFSAVNSLTSGSSPCSCAQLMAPLGVVKYPSNET